MSDSLRMRVRALAQRSLKSAHRLLVEPSDPGFIESVERRLRQTHARVDPEEIPDAAIQRAIKFVYSLVLYDAFLQDGSVKQERAFRSAQAYLYPMLLRAANGDDSLASDLAQQTLLQAWSTLHRKPLLEPGTFSYYLLRVGISLIGHYFRQRRSSDRSLDTDERQVRSADGSEAAFRHFAPEGVREVERVFEDGEQGELIRERLPEIVRRCLEGRANYLRVIEQHILAGRSYKELATAWGCTAASLAVDKFRALDKLRQCPELIRFVREELSLPYGPAGGT